MSEIITPEVSQRICRHMNEDHSDAVVLYARIYGNSPAAKTAQMISIDARGMELLVEGTEEQKSPIRIEFQHQLESAQDAHHTLIEMLKQARQA
jgi:putative heme iron utilization protein